MVDISEAIAKIKDAGSTKVRTVPMSGENALTGKYQIELNNNGTWVSIACGMSRKMCEDIISQALNRVILG
jgi:hypothetical protein